MEYIIFDLEWSRCTRRVKLRCPDEIIQIGAVKYSADGKPIGSFNRYILPSLYKSIDPMVESMTGISMELLSEKGIPFSRAIKEFRAFIGHDEPVLMSWGVHDAVVLKNNCLYYNKEMRLSWLTRFADLQCYVAKKLTDKNNHQQLGLSAAADLLKMEYSAEALHDALEDAALSGRVFSEICDYASLKPYIIDASKLHSGYKSVHITDLKNPLISRREFLMRCPVCGRFITRLSPWTHKNKKFIARHRCKNCNLSFSCSVEALMRVNNDIHYKKRCRIIGAEERNTKHERSLQETERAGLKGASVSAFDAEK